MKTFWSDCWRIWKYAVYYRTTRLYKIIGGCLLAVGVIWPLVSGAGFVVEGSANWRTAICLGAGIPLSTIFIYVLAQLVSATARKNSPANACLVPRLRTRIIWANILAWLVVTAITTLIFGMLSGQYGWCFVLIGLYLIGVGWGQVQAWAGFIGVLPSVYFMVGRQLPPTMHALAWGNSALAVGMLMLPVVGYVFIQTAFPRGSERHWKQRGFLMNRARVRIGKASWGTGRISTFLQNGYARALRRACANPSSPKLIMHVFGPGVHWFLLLCVAAIALALTLCIKTGFLLFSNTNGLIALTHMGSIPAGLGMLLLVLATRQPVIRMHTTPTEQALFRLSPWMPSLHALNRQLARNLLRNAVQNWLILLCTVMGISALIGAPADALIIQFSRFCLTLPLLGIPLLDYTSAARLQRNGLIVWIVAADVAVQLAVFSQAGTAAWLGVALGNALLALAVITWRWRAMVAAPIAFPAGRMA